MIVALSGCFDMFHDGHRHLITKAIDFAGAYGKLVVAINDDESVMLLKGDDRPAVKLEHRIESVKKFALRTKGVGVELYVIDFEDETQLEKIYNIFSPDVLLHGDDITDVTKVTGFRKYPILIVPRVTDSDDNELSTTKRIEKNDKANT